MIMKVGLRLVQSAELGDFGEDSLLNGLDEGVIILDENTGTVSFANTVA